MLSYQHLYHAGNLADVHKHALLSVALDYMTRKDKPLTYVETHAGRGLYDLSAPEAVKTGEAAEGIAKVAGWFKPDHPYAKALEQVRTTHGPTAYPGSPLIAASLLRPDDAIHLAELHPQERSALHAVLRDRARIRAEDGFDMALALTPPTPRRGMLLCDPSFEVKEDYDTIPRVFAQLNRKWNVGVLALWYPILDDSLAAPHRAMVRTLQDSFPEALTSEVRFPRLKPGKGLMGSGLFVVNPPWGLDLEAARLAQHFAAL